MLSARLGDRSHTPRDILGAAFADNVHGMMDFQFHHSRPIVSLCLTVAIATGSEHVRLLPSSVFCSGLEFRAARISFAHVSPGARVFSLLTVDHHASYSRRKPGSYEPPRL